VEVESNISIVARRPSDRARRGKMTSPHGGRYFSDIFWRRDLSPGGRIFHVAEKAIFENSEEQI